jgi:dTDP-4-amino-4,6-dideoxygalactose transaminase
MVIPFVNLRLQYESIQNEIDQAVKEAFTNSQFIGGDYVKKFEQNFAHQFQIKHCIGTGNGTDSLFIILKGLGIGSGDEVITPAFSCIPSAECITLTGASVVFADVDDRYYTLDSVKVEEKITAKTKAVIAVHLYGQAAPLAQLKKLCDKYNLLLIEDCAQAHLTKEHDGLAGTVGIASAFSFYPTKNLGAYGDAGCILTHDNELAEKFRRLANHGALNKNDHLMEGTNSRLDALQAAILSVKLKHLPQWNAKRIAIADKYTSFLKDISELNLPAVRENTTHTFHIFSIRSTHRDELKQHLAAQGIETAIHYPEGLPFTHAYQYKKHSSEDFPVTYSLQNEVLSLPVYPELNSVQIEFIAQNIRNYFSR